MIPASQCSPLVTLFDIRLRKTNKPTKHLFQYTVDFIENDNSDDEEEEEKNGKEQKKKKKKERRNSCLHKTNPKNNKNLRNTISSKGA